MESSEMLCPIRFLNVFHPPNTAPPPICIKVHLSFPVPLEENGNAPFLWRVAPLRCIDEKNVRFFFFP